MQLTIFDKAQVKNKDQILLDLFSAYYDARKNKRNTINQLQFEIDYEKHIIKLYEQIISYNYKLKRSICFVVNQPVKREIFAADFADRVVHHFIYNYIMPIFDPLFINDSYSCRTGKGTHYGIKRINHFIRSCSRNYKQDCYILKLDIKGYFMGINKELLYNKVKQTLISKKEKCNFDLPLILYLIEKTVFNDSTENCYVKGKRSNWEGLPKSKSLFHVSKNCGLPIGNLTSQLFGNVYLNDLDHFVKKQLKIKYYGRYVDDFILIHPDKDYLKLCISHIRNYLKEQLYLELHPDKIYLQHFSKGVKYLGAVIKPHRIYIANRTKGNFYAAIEEQNIIVRDHKPTKEEQKAFLSSMNSYLGILKHYKTYKIRRKMILENLSAWWWNYVYLSNNIGKFVLKRKVIQS